MSTFVLVHGAWHGAWCWAKLVPLLEHQGHTVVAPDLPGHGNDEMRLSAVTLNDYADRILEVLDEQSERAILVGHDMSGIVLSEAAERCPDKISTLVYMAAFMLRDGECMLDLARTDEGVLVTPNLVLSRDQRFAGITEDVIKDAFYTDCLDEEAEWAKANLMPIEPTNPFGTSINITEENFGRLPRVYIECLRDRAISASLQRQMYTALRCERIITLQTGHSPFLSMPAVLARHLSSVASMPPSGHEG